MNLDKELYGYFEKCSVLKSLLPINSWKAITQPSMTVSRSKRIPAATPLQPRRRAIIVGASGGIGAALALRLAREGFILGLVGRRKEALQAVAEGINAHQAEIQVLTYVHDVTHYDSVPSLLRKIVAEIGGLDLVIYVAGVNKPPGIENYIFDADREMVEVNLVGAMAWLDPVSSMFQAAGTGHIVGISSVAGDRGRVGNPGYNASKAGLTAYLEALRNRLTRFGVHVLTVKPGFVRTEMLKAAPRVMFPITAERAANEIWNAIRERKQQIYTPPVWTLIMLIVRNIPSIIFRRLSF